LDRRGHYLRGSTPPTLAEVEIGIVAESAWDDVKRVALEQPDEGSGERWP